MPDQEPAVVESGENRHTRERYFMRFTRAQRYLHAALFTSFLGWRRRVSRCVSARASGRAAWRKAWADSELFFSSINFAQ